MTRFIEPIRSSSRGGPYRKSPPSSPTSKEVKESKFKVGDIVTLSVWLMHSEGCVILEVLPEGKYLVQLGPNFGGTFNCMEGWLRYA